MLRSPIVLQSPHDEKPEADHESCLGSTLWLLDLARIGSSVLPLCDLASAGEVAMSSFVVVNRMLEAPSLYVLIELHSDVLLHLLGVRCGLLRVGTKDVLKEDRLRLLLGRALEHSYGHLCDAFNIWEA
eukprot:4168295-Amphidinium_carterae.1